MFASNLSLYLMALILLIVSFSILLYYFQRIKIQGKQKSASLLKTAIKKPDISALYGTWVIDNERHLLRTFTLSASQLTTVDKDIDTHHLVIDNHKCCNTAATKIVGTFILNRKDTVYRNPNNLPWYEKYINDDVYRLILHDNGLIKFKPIGNSNLHAIALARVDSPNTWDWVLNVIHAARFGCFCFCILTEDGKFKRYNRWYGAVELFYTAEKI